MTAIDKFFNEIQRMQYFIGNNMLAVYNEAKELHNQQIKDAYNQGYRDGKQDWDILLKKDVAKYSNAQNYYNEKFGGNNEQP